MFEPWIEKDALLEEIKPGAAALFAELKALADKLAADRMAHMADVNDVRSRARSTLSLDDVNAGQKVALAGYHLDQRELTLRQRLQNEWYPLLATSFYEGRNREIAAARAAAEKAKAQVTSGLVKLGFEPLQETPHFQVMVRMHPDHRAARERLDRTEAPAGFVKTHEDDNAKRIAELDAQVQNQWQRLIQV